MGFIIIYLIYLLGLMQIIIYTYIGVVYNCCRMYELCFVYCTIYTVYMVYIYYALHTLYYTIYGVY